MATALASARPDAGALEEFARSLGVRSAFHRLGSLAETLELRPLAEQLVPLSSIGRPIPLDPTHVGDADRVARREMGSRLAVRRLRTRGDRQTVITRGAITQIADRDGVSAVVVERDYVLTHIVDSLARADGSTGLVFKGGTALRLCFYDDFRYSADLDFSLEGLGIPEALEVIRTALKLAAGSIELPSLEIPDGDPPAIHYVGPLGRERSIKVDLADDELVIKTTDRAVIRRYTDQPDEAASLRTYALEEAAGEKLRCVIQRQLCRDVSDLHRLFVQEGVDVEDAWAIFEQKARFKNRDPLEFAERLASREPQYRQRWHEELSDLEPNAPPFDEVIRQLRRALRDHL